MEIYKNTFRVIWYIAIDYLKGIFILLIGIYKMK